jgi:hypothetical protein
VDPLLIGLDGGATELKAHEVVPLFGGMYTLGEHRASRVWAADPRCAAFAPAPLDVQRSGAAPLSAEELAAGAAWADLTVEALVELSRDAGRREIEVGACFPGLKTADRRGIRVSRNGPRVPDLAERIERGLRSAGLRLVAPLGALASDGHCCGIGEEHATSGALRGARDAYYLGGGTGLPEALKLDGRVRSLDQLADVVRKAWELELAPGVSFEQELAPARLNERWSRCAAQAQQRVFVEQAAEAGDANAIELLARAGAVLAALCFERLTALRAAEARRTLERIVFGQRLGEILAGAGGAHALAAFFEHLAAMIEGAGDAELARVWLNGGGLCSERIVLSRLRAAPALGAAVLARDPAPA